MRASKARMRRPEPRKRRGIVGYHRSARKAVRGALSPAAARFPAANPRRRTGDLGGGGGHRARGRTPVRSPGAATSALAMLAFGLRGAAPHLALETLMVPGHHRALHGAAGEV